MPVPGPAPAGALDEALPTVPAGLDEADEEGLDGEGPAPRATADTVLRVMVLLVPALVILAVLAVVVPRVL